MRDELDDHPEDYRSLTYEYWCDLLSKIKVKDESKIAVVLIKKISSAREASLYLTYTITWGFLGRRRPRLVTCPLINIQRRRTGTTVYIVIVCFARSQECLSTSTLLIVPRIALACAPTYPSEMEWEDLWEVVLMLWSSIRSLKKM